MNTYIITIKFTDGDEAHIRCVAVNQAAALARLQNTPQFTDFAKDKAIESMTAEIEKTPAKKCEYLLQPSKDLGYWIATDTINKCVIKFKERKYNETAKITFLEDIKKMDVLDIAAILRGLGDFLANNHRELI